MDPTSKHLETAEIVVGGGNRPVPAVGTARGSSTVARYIGGDRWERASLMNQNPNLQIWYLGTVLNIKSPGLQRFMVRLCY